MHYQRITDIDMGVLTHPCTRKLAGYNKSRLILQADRSNFSMNTNCKSYSGTNHCVPSYEHASGNGIFRRKSHMSHSELEQLVTEIIVKIGIPANLKGYRYLRSAIILVLSDMTFLDSVTKRLYPAIADCNNTTSIRVERAIRHAITAAWNRGNGDSGFIEDMLRCHIDFSHSKPTNSELIALISDSLRMIIM